MTLWQLTLLSVLAGFLIDCAVGDPAWLPHPVVLIGKAISLSEKGLRRIFPKTDRGAFWAGLVMAILVPLVSAVVVFWILFGMWKLSPWAYFAASAVMSWQCLAARCLMTEANKVVKALETEGLDAGRKQVSMLVGRDTERLSEEQVLKATVETVAEMSATERVTPIASVISLLRKSCRYQLSVKPVQWPSVLDPLNEKIIRIRIGAYRNSSISPI